MLPFARISTYGNTIPTINDIKEIQTNNNSIFILTNGGNLYARGTNNSGQLGNGNTTAITAAWTLVNTNVESVWCTINTTLIRKFSGTWHVTGMQRCIGVNGATSGVWNDVSSVFSAVPSTANKVSVSYDGVAVVDSSGNLYTAGYNTNGQLGTGNTTIVSTMTLRTDVGLVIDAKFTKDNTNTLYVIKNDGTLIGAGVSLYGQLAGTTSSTTFLTLGTGVLSLYTGNYCGFFIKSDGVYVLGSQFNGQLGDGVYTTNIGTVGRTSLFKLTTSSTPTMICSGQYYTHMLIGSTWYWCGAGTPKVGNGTNAAGTGTLSSITVSVPTLKSNTEWIHGTNNSYVLSSNSVLYGCGTYAAASNLMPNFTTTQATLIALNTTI